MPNFTYSARDSQGSQTQGVIDATDSAAAADMLIGRGLSYDQRKPMMKQYAMDWRLANGGALPANEAKEAAHD